MCSVSCFPCFLVSCQTWSPEANFSEFVLCWPFRIISFWNIVYPLVVPGKEIKVISDKSCPHILGWPPRHWSGATNTSSLVPQDLYECFFDTGLWSLWYGSKKNVYFLSNSQIIYYMRSHTLFPSQLYFRI